MNPDLSAAVDRCPVLSRIGLIGRSKLVPHARIVEYERGRTLYSHEMPADRCFVILTGWVKLYRVRHSGDEAVIRMQRQGETLGVDEGMRNGRYRHHASAVSPSKVLVFPAQIMRETLEADPEFGKALLHHLFDVNDQLYDQIEALKSRKAIERLANFLQTHARTRKGKTFVTLPYDKTTLAAYLGMQPESLSRALAQLSEYGVRVTRDRMEITDINALLALTHYGKDGVGVT
ncbi:hypothetical protein DDZ14_13770 [Maritimibacter sp. 55A14]|uniref:Crp/Fnr family transcriptional regulator n=1 Tax=Maritimibacter sp. 55A14 TaxID=2174844 RepID=UPI000D616439|nr:cyclic nucleotide-binding domain-containing protein [Maritimibacter sp. 55A14]PWE31247.1 hypothetical protein DDZ14_13770 [Maritimibacter sp. 55A14]